MPSAVENLVTHRIASVALLFAICLASYSSAGTYYIAPDGSNSTGDGSQSNPWATIRYATDRMPDDGSTLIVKDGLYVGAQSLGRSFTKTAVIRAENPYKARFQSPATSTRAFYCYSGSNVCFSGLEFFGSGSTGGEYLMHLGAEEVHHLTFENCLIHDSYNNDVVKVNNKTHDVNQYLVRSDRRNGRFLRRQPGQCRGREARQQRLL